jgi:hypothetical protein
MMMCVAVLAVAGCSSTNRDGKPMPELTFENLPPVTLNASAVDFVLNYNPGEDKQDISSRFVMTPGDALRRYTAHRYVAGGGDQTLRVMLDQGSIHIRELKQKNSALKWADIGTEDEYELNMAVRVVPIASDRREGTSMQWKFRRTLVMPQSVSLAEREKRQLEFLEKLMADIDKSMMEGLTKNTNLVRNY